MSVHRPKVQQGRKCTRIKPALHIPDHATNHHKRIDRVLGEIVYDHEKPIGPPKPPTEPSTHRHKYKKLLRVNPENGNRVMGCNCGDYTVVPVP
jgi:hypothetical protein